MVTTAPRGGLEVDEQTAALLMAAGGPGRLDLTSARRAADLSRLRGRRVSRNEFPLNQNPTLNRGFDPLFSETRIAVGTGAARDIGAHVAERLVSDGFPIAIVDLDESAGEPIVEKIRPGEGDALSVGADVWDEAPCKGSSPNSACHRYR